MPPLNLLVGHSSITVRVQPVVLFTICDAYIRRSEGKERVIGTLLGTIAEGVVDIRNCYAVPHNESMDQVRQLKQPARRPRHEQLPGICLQALPSWAAYMEFCRSSRLSNVSAGTHCLTQSCKALQACCAALAACPLHSRLSTWQTAQLPLVQVEMDIAHHRTLLDLHHKVNMRERIVGW